MWGGTKEIVEGNFLKEKEMWKIKKKKDKKFRENITIFTDSSKKEAEYPPGRSLTECLKRLSNGIITRFTLRLGNSRLHASVSCQIYRKYPLLLLVLKGRRSYTTLEVFCGQESVAARRQAIAATNSFA